jgi:hypothetical protein
MNQSLFQAEDTAEVVRRIQALKPDSKAQWGKMDVAQMLAHCQVPLEIATGQRTMKRGLIGLLFGRMAKKKLAGPEPFKRGLPTAPEFVVRDQRDFAAEREKLLALVQSFQRRGPEALAREHPFFGPMTTTEWDRLQWKHLDHHLRQFGA